MDEISSLNIRTPNSMKVVFVEPFEAFVRRKLDQLTAPDLGNTKALEAKIAALEEALRPLAECAIIGPGGDHLPDGGGARYFMTYGEIRRARRALGIEREST